MLSPALSVRRGTVDVQGEEQQKLDGIANDIFLRTNEFGGRQRTIASGDWRRRRLRHLSTILTWSDSPVLKLFQNGTRRAAGDATLRTAGRARHLAIAQ
ncbi:hypothetical protein M5I08_04135 [Candidatus Mycobacterium methanotrophicum]|uniref:Uncharacterized protein n=1 Tax=Candidatus Mycobacterium methanotrophicum TaxID=2943498 RepID=A0ABY4QMX4_9MYCO|nr:hypothetical protein [Candidatus Mycobacterium methanotrophicum]UQX11663.1 hypothetical protein M5I08_04135 [Candidatus Mycobacterium methanotrophicum]